MDFPRYTRSLILGTVAILSAAGLHLLTAQAPAEPEQRIRQIQDAILPPVISKGEPPATTRLADRMAALHVPGVSIAVIHDGKIEWARGFGVTRVGGPAVTPNTLFQAASISKPVTALAVLHLVESGKLDLDADANRYLKSWKIPAGSFTDTNKVTLRELLTHTAGMTVHGFPGYAAGSPRPSEVQILNGEKPANTPAILVDTAPGANWRYSGGGFVVTQLLLEDVTGQPFPTLMHDLVLAPIGMTHSTYQQPLPDNRMAEVAMPYRPDGQPVPGGPHVYPEMAPAGLWTTPSDLARYAIEVQKALAGKSKAVISAAMARQMLTPGKNRWGLGIGTGGAADHPYFTHGGANEGFQCNLVAYNNGDGAVIMTNSDAGGQLANEILRTIAYQYKWPDFGPREASDRKEITLPSDVLSKYVGAYQMGPGVNMLITLENNQLFSKLGNQPAIPIFPASRTMFFPKVVDAELEFTQNDAQGRPTQMILHQNGRDMPANRLSDAEAKRAADAAAAFAKRFRDQTPAPGSEAAVRKMIEDLQAGKPNYEMMSTSGPIRQLLPQLQSDVANFGKIQSITFQAVGSGGADIFSIRSDKGAWEFRVWLAPDGKVDNANIRPVQ